MIGPDGKRLAIYARVSTQDQDLTGQVERLQAWASDRELEIVEDVREKASGKDRNRDGFRQLMRQARMHDFDAIAVTKIDRWARSLIDLDRTVGELADLGVAFFAIDQGLRLDPDDPMGRAMIRMLGTLAELEADLISERTKAGLEQARKKGNEPGRSLKPCAVCGGKREHGLRARVDGPKRPVCVDCDDLPPDVRRKAYREQREPEQP